MNVAVVQTFAADHNNGVTYRTPCRFECAGLCIGKIKQEHHFVAKFAHINRTVVVVAFCNCFQLTNRGTSRFIGFWHWLAIHHMNCRIKEQQESRTTCVDNTSIFENWQQFWCSRQCISASSTSRMQSGRQSCASYCCCGRTVGSFAHHSQDGSFDWLQHRFIRCSRCALQCVGHAGGIDLAIGAFVNSGNEPSEDLAEDDTTISSGTHERAMTDGFAGGIHLGAGAFKFSHHSIEGAGHICTCIAVWDWVYVEAVDAWGVGTHCVTEGNHRATDLICPQ